jgi:hypothetical protein
VRKAGAAIAASAFLMDFLINPSLQIYAAQDAGFFILLCHMDKDLNIALTGMPRSGTTLTCFLINKIDNAVALHEPIRPQQELKGHIRPVQLEKIKQYFIDQRTSLLERGVAISKHRDGMVPDNDIQDKSESISNSGLEKRAGNLSKGEVFFDKKLDKSFNLIIKHPPLFTAMLPEIQDFSKTYAILRNPLAAMLSWHSVSFPISRGRLPTAEFIDPIFKENLDAEENVYNRYGIVMQWFLHRYVKYLQSDHLIKYEDIIASGGKALSLLGLPAQNLNEKLMSKNTSKIYDRKLVDVLYDTIQKYYTTEIAQLYSIDEIKKLRNQLVTE